MGHFSVSDLVSRQHIAPGEECAIILLSSDTHHHDGRLNSKTILYHDQLWEPASLPIIGEYDGYGCLENIKSTASVKAMEQSLGLPIEKIIEFIRSDRDITDNYSPISKEVQTADKELIAKWERLSHMSITFIKLPVYEFMTSFGADEYDLNDGTNEILKWAGKSIQSMKSAIASYKPADLSKLEKQLKELAKDPESGFTLESVDIYMEQLKHESKLGVPTNMRYKDMYLNIGSTMLIDADIISEFKQLYVFEHNAALANIFWTPTLAILQDGGNHVVAKIAEFIVANMTAESID